MKITRGIKLSLYALADAFAFIFVWALVLLNNQQLVHQWMYLPIGAILQFAFLIIFKIYNMITLHFGLNDALKVFFITALTNVFFGTMYVLFIQASFAMIEIFFVIIALPFALVSLRLARRILAAWLGFKKNGNVHKTRTLVIGAGAAGKLIIDELTRNPLLHAEVVVVVDDDTEKLGRTFLTYPVRGPIQDVATIIEQFHIQQVVVAIGNITRSRLFEILRLMEKSNVKIRRLPLMEELEKNASAMKIKDVSVEELLGRDVIPLINEDIEAFIKDKTILVTGAGGSIGSELVRQIYQYEPEKIVLLDMYENGVYDVQQQLVQFNRNRNKPIPIKVIIASTYHHGRMKEIFDIHRPKIVFHAAAYKHVPLMEDAPQEAVRTNILGTYNLAELSHMYGVEKMVLVSTDKAVRPTNVMGATKYYAETIIRHFATISQTTAYSAVRFGNVLASNGSVIPLFQKQIAAGGPVTVTHPEITRYFMTIPEAVGLILQSSVYATGGEIFVLDMGEPVKIVDLAEKMIRQSGYIPYEEIAIEFTGLRPGEKMYEELLLDASKNIKTANQKIFIERTQFVKFDKNQYANLLALAESDSEQLVTKLFAIIGLPKEKLKEEI